MIRNVFVVIFVWVILSGTRSMAQRVAFDSLIANNGVNKSIVWTPSTYQNGYGHRIYGADGGGKTDLRFAARHNTTNWADILTITSNGKFGFGTTNPIERFEVAGSLGTVQVAAGNGVKIVFTRNNANYIETSSRGGYLIFSTNASQERMRIDSNGNVGIGTVNPGTYKLAVEGVVGARKVKVTQSSWADYVFEPDYILPSLQEVENYILTNRHLPDIPTATEVAQEGLDIGEMNRKLLQKVEELTLYVIELKKEINQLKSSQK